MAGMRWPPEDAEPMHARTLTASDLFSDDDRSVAADSWSIKSEYGSTLDDDQRHADAAESLSSGVRAASDYSSDKDEADVDADNSMLGLQSYWDSAYAGELVNFHEHGHTGEIWLPVTVRRHAPKKVRLLIHNADIESCTPVASMGPNQMTCQLNDVPMAQLFVNSSPITLAKFEYKGTVVSLFFIRMFDSHKRFRFGIEVMEIVAVWTKNLCVNFPQGHCKRMSGETTPKSNPGEEVTKALSRWNVLDIGTGNGLLLQELAKQGFSDLTGVDYSEGAIDLARNLAVRDGFPNIQFLVDDVLETKLENRFQLVTDKGTFDAIGLHPDGSVKRLLYWESMSKLVAPGGLLVITSCNNTKDELVGEAENFCPRSGESVPLRVDGSEARLCPFRYIDHVKSYPTFTFAGVEGSRVATVAFVRRVDS